MRFATPREEKVFKYGFEEGKKEGLRKAALLIQVALSDSEEFTQSILQNSREAIELREIMTGKR